MNKKIESQKKYYYAVGRRKTAIAKVRLYFGKGTVSINEKVIENPDPLYLAPLESIGSKNKFDISVKTLGGGKTSQVEAIRHGISRALVKYNPEFRLSLKKSGYLTRDPREKERKKPGLKRARRAPQWQKR